MKKANCDKVSVTDAGLLVPSGKSRRLSALAMNASRSVNGSVAGVAESLATPSAEEIESRCKKARFMIDQRIEAIKMRLPPGKRNKLFAIRYGESEVLKRKSLREIFQRLNIEEPPNFETIAKFDYDGHPVDDFG